jgi:UDP-N-acetylmuramoyl-tripeptide--D-alanyl-D-alanine ligase
VVIDSRQAGPGTLFVGLRGERVDGGEFAPQAAAAGAWGVLVAPPFAERVAASGDAGAAVIAAEDPLLALQRLATRWRRELGAMGHRGDRFDRQDHDQGHPRLPARPV